MIFGIKLVSNSIKNEFDREPIYIYNETFLKPKIKFNSDGAADFYNKELPKVGSEYIF